MISGISTRLKSAFADTGLRNWLTLLVLFGAAFLLYLPSANFEFIYYDSATAAPSMPVPPAPDTAGTPRRCSP